MNAPSAAMRPAGPADVVLDTDTYNEIDDQFALAYLLRSSPMLRTQAVYAAPFSDPSHRFGNFKSDNPAYGMEKSYQEILKILPLCGREDLSSCVFHGSTRYLADEQTPVESAAARDLAQRAMAYTPEQPLYVVGIAAATNIASALLLNPSIRDRIVVVWLGGNAHTWPHNLEFNASQDIAAARVLFDSGVPLVQLPCMGVVSAFTTSGPELTHWLSNQNPLCDYLLDTVLEEMKDCRGGAGGDSGGRRAAGGAERQPFRQSQPDDRTARAGRLGRSNRSGAGRRGLFGGTGIHGGGSDP